MKETTRIHIAKVSYDIELAAKKELEKYIEKLGLYADDDDVLRDIEIRITELLQERGIEKDGVIAHDDVDFLRTQLGDPKEFLGDGDIAIGTVIENDTTVPRRRLYRDQESAVLGGVLSGFAKYFDVNPLWARLVFVVLLLASFGGAALVYVVLWSVIPPARTAAEKLELTGKPVTLASIKELNETSTEVADRARTSKTVQAVFFYGLGTFSAVAAAGTLVFTVWMGFGLWLESSSVLGDIWSGIEWGRVSVLSLFVLSGILLSSLFGLISYALFARRMTKKIGVSLVAIIVSGVLIFGTGIGGLLYGAQYQQSDIAKRLITSRTNLSPEFANVKKLVVKIDSQVGVSYSVDSSQRYELFALKEAAKPKITINGTTAVLTWSTDNASYPPSLQLYGPQLDEVVVERGLLNYDNNQPQITLRAVEGDVSVSGQFDTVTAVVNRGNLDLSSASIKKLDADVQTGTVSAGVVGALSVRIPESCPAYSTTTITLRGVSSDRLSLNGVEESIRAIYRPCGSIEFNSDEVNG